MSSTSKKPVITRLRAVIAAAVTAVIVASGALMFGLTVAPANAATPGPGWNVGGYSPVGAWRMSDGTLAYCLEPDNSTHPLGAGDGNGYYTGPRAFNGKNLSSIEMRRLNWAISTYGQRGDNVTSAAVQVYVWSITDPEFGDRGSMGGRIYYSSRAGSSQVAVRAVYDEIAAAAGGVTAPTPLGSGSAQLGIDMTDGYNGAVRIHELTPNNASGTLTLTGATFNATGTSVLSGTFVAGGRYPITGTPTDADAGKYHVTVNGSFNASVAAGGYTDELWVRDYAGQQKLGRPGRPPVTSISWNAPAFAADPVTTFEPVIATSAPRYVTADEPGFRDTLTASVTGSNPWKQWEDNAYFDVVTKGTLYGPFLTQPAESATPPADAPVVATETKTLTGPGVYRSNVVPKLEPGYYAWVWEIDYADQDWFTQQDIPAGYQFADRFGLVAETQIVPPAVTTEAIELQRLGSPVTDTAEVVGNVYEDATIGFKAYKQNFDVATYEMVGDPTCTPENLVFTSAPKPVDSAGFYTSDEFTPTTTGQYHWVATLYGENGEDVVVGDCGDPQEISTIVQFSPVATTQADPYVIKWHTSFQVTPDADGLPGGFEDTLTVGTAGTDGWWTGVEVLAKGTLYGPFEDAPEQSADVPVDAPIAASDVELKLTGPGEYVSPVVDADVPGYYTWVWAVNAAEQTPETQFFLPDAYDWADDFGVPSETQVVPPKVTTKATEIQAAGLPTKDTATIEGIVFDGARIVFDLFKKDESKNLLEGEHSCVTDNHVFRSEPVEITGTTVESDVFTPTEAGTYYWLAAVLAPDDTEVWVDECMLPDETTTVKQVLVTTVATPEMTAGDEAKDVATIRGTIPDGALLTFDVYRQNTDIPTCDATSLRYTTGTQGLTPGVVDGVTYDSQAVRIQTGGTYFWVERVLSADGAELHRGECGAPLETTVAEDQLVGAGFGGGKSGVARTGVDDSFLMAAGLAAILSLIAGVGVASAASMKRRKAAVS